VENFCCGLGDARETQGEKCFNEVILTFQNGQTKAKINLKEFEFKNIYKHLNAHCLKILGFGWNASIELYS